MEPNIAQREPVLTAASAGALAAALVTILVQFGVPISDAQADAISVFVVLAFPIVAAMVARRKTTPADQVVERVGGDGTVVAGPANELPTGVLVRDDLGTESGDSADREALDALTEPQPRRGRDDDGDGTPDIA